MATRRKFLVAGLAGALGAARARPSAARRESVTIGMLVSRPLSDSWYARGLVQRLGELGYRDGDGARIEYRSADGRPERYPALARELVELQCALVFAIGPEQTVRPFASAPLPVVFVAVDYDPVEKGVVPNLRAPGGNMTGVYTPQNALVAKRFEIMRDVAPAVRRFLVLSDLFSRDQLPYARSAADAAGVEMTVVEFAKRPYGFAAAFDQGMRAGVGAYVGLASPVFASHGAEVAALLARHRLPGVGSAASFADFGYLLSYGADATKMTRRAAEIGVRILNGGRAADIPVQQADEFELVANLKTARALGIVLSPSVLARATRIIQ